MNFPINVFAFIRDGLLVMAAYFFLAAAFHTWGNFFAKLIGIAFNGKTKIFANIWLGWTFCLIFFSIYHLFFPINAFASCIFYLPAIIVFFIKYGNKLYSFVKELEKLKIIAVVLILFAASLIAIQAPVNYDTGLYHLNSIRWANEHHIIKGLGNLHTRLGVNQLYFLYVASLNFHPFFNDYAFHIANSFLYATFAVGMILSGTVIDLLLLCLFFYIPMPYYWIANPTPDIASTLLQIIAFRFFLEAIHFDPKGKYRIYYISFAAIISALLVTVKLSNVVFALGLGFVTMMFYRKNPFSKSELVTFKKTFIVIGLFVLVWIVRGYIQTGYPLFPSSIGAIKFDWSVPKRLANYTENCVYCGSRTNGQIYDPNHPIFMEKWAWLDFWVKWNFFDESEYLCDDFYSDLTTWLTLIFFPMVIFNWGMGSLTLFAVSLILFIVWLRALFRQKGLFEKTNYIFYLFLVGIACIGFWFFVAPEVRFANGCFIILFVSALLLVKTSYSNMRIIKEFKNAIMIFPIAMFLWAFWLGYSVDAFRIDGISLLNKVPMRSYKTDSGLELLIPVKSDQSWDSNLPSTPEPEKGLSLLGNSLDDGFCIRESK